MSLQYHRFITFSVFSSFSGALNHLLVLVDVLRYSIRNMSNVAYRVHTWYKFMDGGLSSIIFGCFKFQLETLVYFLKRGRVLSYGALMKIGQFNFIKIIVICILRSFYTTLADHPKKNTKLNMFPRHQRKRTVVGAFTCPGKSKKVSIENWDALKRKKVPLSYIERSTCPVLIGRTIFNKSFPVYSSVHTSHTKTSNK